MDLRHIIQFRKMEYALEIQIETWGQIRGKDGFEQGGEVRHKTAHTISQELPQGVTYMSSSSVYNEEKLLI